MSSPPSFSSAATTTSDHIHHSLYPQLHHEHNTPSLSDVRSFDKSYTGNDQIIPIPEMYQPTAVAADQPPSFPALARDQGNSHKNAEAAPDYYNNGQPPTIGSIDNRSGNSQASAAGGAYDGYGLPPSRNDVAPRETSQTGSVADDQNVVPQPYGQMSIIGRKIRKFEPPAYYTE
ncbi:hypothetical protein L6452_09831 [Arctium lappa]|uniref:Uncharacterized protein n=1 Tax=Arctium lappa TaxID=4217 RepID=A0ACB9DLG3_ARCLA|nr:hypothetical protein L6452_09831 [Arctium lappa]